MPSRPLRRNRISAGLLPVALLALAGPCLSVATEGGGDDFRGCLARLGEQSRAAGISEPTVRDVLGRVEWQPRVIELDRRQPEFTTTFADYYAKRVTADRVDRGRTLLRENRRLLERVRRQYGVPPHYLLAFWGLETNFGSYFGNIRVPDSLATLACDGRRGEFFTAELIAALRIIDAGDIAPEKMFGSWAGAMGNFQFLPSVFLAHAVDADGDGRRDIWGSLDDAMASAGRFLADLGWERGLRWGREIRLPDAFDYTLSGRDVRKPLREWVALGITDAFGGSLPRLDLPASIMVPSGHEGPAFIVYRNFDVIMGWNRSEYYALAVGRLADRIAGGGNLVRPPPPTTMGLSRETVRRLQERLAALGHDPGAPDGIPGSATRRAVREFQREHGLLADGHIDAELLDMLETTSP